MIYIRNIIVIYIYLHILKIKFKTKQKKRNVRNVSMFLCSLLLHLLLSSTFLTIFLLRNCLFAVSGLSYFHSF